MVEAGPTYETTNKLKPPGEKQKQIIDEGRLEAFNTLDLLYLAMGMRDQSSTLEPSILRACEDGQRLGHGGGGGDGAVPCYLGALANLYLLRGGGGDAVGDGADDAVMVRDQLRSVLSLANRAEKAVFEACASSGCAGVVVSATAAEDGHR